MVFGNPLINAVKKIFAIVKSFGFWEIFKDSWKLIKDILSIIEHLWEKFKELWSIIKSTRFSIVLLILMAFFLIGADQGQDVLRAITETEHSFSTEAVLFFAALFLWAFNTWYWTRVMLRFDFDSLYKSKKQYEQILIFNKWSWTRIRLQRDIDKDDKLNGLQKNIRKYTPRVLGLSTFIVTFFAFSQISEHVFSNYSIACLLFAYVFYHLIKIRIPLLEKIYQYLSNTSYKNQKWISWFKVRDEEKDYKATYKTLKELPAATWISIVISGSISIILFFLFWISPNSAAIFGAAAIVLLAASSWVTFGSVLIYLGSKYTFPVITLLLALAIWFSLYNDNHEIRYLKKEAMHFKDRVSLSKHANTWFNDLRLSKNQTDANKSIPYFIVAAEGGGIRAAYWTALVLSKFQDSNPHFSQHLYAISGVSGGSLGAAVFTALLHKHAEDNNQTSIQDLAIKILSNDFLSPTIASMLYPDLTQRFVPFVFLKCDRSQALEGAWELAWSKAFSDSRTKDEVSFSKNFLNLWNLQPDNNTRIPNLFLNATWVETGKRVITSNLIIDAQTFSDSIDFFNVLKRDLRLSTAVHNSARFTYVSPAGTIRSPEEEVWGHLVDGGYFENSGTSTAYDILTAIMNQNFTKHQFKPIVIVITNDPAVKESQENVQNDHYQKPHKFMNEIWSPAATLLNTRNARGSYARNKIKNFITENNGTYLEVGLCGDEGPLPLGWTLSDQAKNNMETQLKNDIYLVNKELKTDKFNPLNHKHLEKLQAVLKKSCAEKKRLLER